MEKNRPKVVEVLIAHGANYNAYTANATPLCMAASLGIFLFAFLFFSPLFFAAKHSAFARFYEGYLECGKVLLKAGANPNAKCNNGMDVRIHLER